MKITNNERGISAVGLMIILIGLSMLAISAVSMMATHQKGQNDFWLQDYAYYVAQAGAEYTLYQYYQGANSVHIVDKAFESGHFDVEETGISPSTLVTVTGRVGDTSKTITFTKPSMAKCLSIDSNSSMASTNLV